MQCAVSVSLQFHKHFLYSAHTRLERKTTISRRTARQSGASLAHCWGILDLFLQPLGLELGDCTATATPILANCHDNTTSTDFQHYLIISGNNAAVMYAEHQWPVCVFLELPELHPWLPSYCCHWWDVKAAPPGGCSIAVGPEPFFVSPAPGARHQGAMVRDISLATTPHTEGTVCTVSLMQ